MSKRKPPERNLSFGWLRLSRNYSFADKQERTAGRSKVVRKFLQKCKKPDTCSGFLRICTANSISCALPRGSVSIAKTDFIDRLNHPNEIYRSGDFLVILEQQKAFVLEPLNYAFERFLIRSADGVQVDAAGQVGQRPGAGLLNLLVKRVGVIPRENVQRCTDLTVYSVLDRHINHGSARSTTVYSSSSMRLLS